jgi:hypothetical protein
MEHIRAIAIGLMALGTIAAFVGLIVLACMYPWIGMPFVILGAAWLIGISSSIDK